MRGWRFDSFISSKVLRFHFSARREILKNSSDNSNEKRGVYMCHLKLVTESLIVEYV